MTEFENLLRSLPIKYLARICAQFDYKIATRDEMIESIAKHNYVSTDFLRDIILFFKIDSRVTFFWGNVLIQGRIIDYNFLSESCVVEDIHDGTICKPGIKKLRESNT